MSRSLCIYWLQVSLWTHCQIFLVRLNFFSFFVLKEPLEHESVAFIPPALGTLYKAPVCTAQ